jgi:hypothetical protein
MPTLASLAFGGLLDVVKVIGPEPLECFGPVVYGFELLCFEAVASMLTVLVNHDQVHFSKDTEVLGNGRLRKPQLEDNFADDVAGGEDVDDLATPRFGDGIEGIGCRGHSRHLPIVFP